MNTNQLINIEIQDSALDAPAVLGGPLMPNVPSTGWGGLTSFMADHSLAASIISIIALALLTSLVVLLIRRKNYHRQNLTKFQLTKPTSKSAFLAGLSAATLGLAALAISAPLLMANADASLTTNTEALTITIDKAKATNAGATTNLTLDNDQANPYEVVATLSTGKASLTSPQVGSDITLTLDGQTLASDSAVTVYEGDSIGTFDFGVDIAVAIADSLSVGVYQASIDYQVVYDLPPPLPVACVSGPKFKGHIGDIINASSIKSTWSIGDTGIATDTRGTGQEYCIGKLADNNIWMLNNLKLGSLTSTMELKPSDTNITSNWTLPQIDNTITSNDYNTPRLYAYVDGQSGFSLSIPNSEEINITSPNFAGYYYNWCAAKGGTAESCTVNSTLPTSSPTDICPANWRMPKGGSLGDVDNELDQLSAKMAGYADNQGQYQNDFDYGSTFANNFQFSGPFRGTFAGYRSGSHWYDQGSWAYVWSASHYPGVSGGAFELDFVSGYVYPNDYWFRGSGLSVRCLLR